MNQAERSHRSLEESIRRGLEYAMHERLAPHYERHLVEDCAYRTPDEVALAVHGLMERGVAHGTRRARWLDLGAGTGLVGSAAARRGIDVDWVAVDASEPMMRMIDCPGYVERVHADVGLGLPFADAAFDGVTAAGLFEHVADALRVLRDVARVLRPGGAFALTFPPNRAGRSELWDEDEGLVSHDPVSMRGALAEVGLDLTHEASYPAYRSGSRGWVIHHIQIGITRSAAERACPVALEP